MRKGVKSETIFNSSKPGSITSAPDCPKAPPDNPAIAPNSIVNNISVDINICIYIYKGPLSSFFILIFPIIY